MSAEENFQLDTWKGDWGLSSVDINCLQVLAYARFCGIPLKVKPTCDPFRTPNGRLPVLRHGDTRIDSTQDIIVLFRQKDYNLEQKMGAKQCAELVAYEHMLKEKLYPALQFIWWIDENNFNKLVRPWYAKAVPFPLNFWYPARYEKAAQTLMEALYPKEESMTAIENKVYSEAQKCLTLLSTRLGDADYFYGSRPTELDALLYAYLAPLLKAPLPNPALQNHLKACTNLVKFVARVSQRFFEEDYQAYEKEKAAESERQSREEADSQFPNKRRNQFVAGVFAVLAMVGYAVSTGIVPVPIRDDDEMSDEDYMLVESDADD